MGIIMFEVIIGLYAFGTLVMLLGMRNAPDAYEDEEGFHIRWQNNAPEIRDVACVWAPVSFSR